MKKKMGGLAIAIASLIALAAPAAGAPTSPITITPGYVNVITTEESTTFEFTGCEGGTVEFVLAFTPAGGKEEFEFLGSLPGGSGSWTFSRDEPGAFKIIVNCFIGGERHSTEEVRIDVVDAVPTTPPVVTTAPPLDSTVPGATTTIAGATTSIGSGGPVTSGGASLGQSALPATGQGDTMVLLVSATALLVAGATLLLVRRRPA